MSCWHGLLPGAEKAEGTISFRTIPSGFPLPRIRNLNWTEARFHRCPAETRNSTEYLWHRSADLSLRDEELRFRCPLPYRKKKRMAFMSKVQVTYRCISKQQSFVSQWNTIVTTHTYSLWISIYFIFLFHKIFLLWKENQVHVSISLVSKLSKSISLSYYGGTCHSLLPILFFSFNHKASLT